MDARYQEYNTNPLLAPYIESYWQMQFTGSSDELTPEHHCLPLGVLELVFNLTNSCFTARINGEEYLLPQTYITGIYEIPVTWRTVGGARMFGIRLRPECLLELFRMPIPLLFNAFYDLPSIFGNLLNGLTAQLLAAPDTGSRIQAAEAFMLGLLHNRRPQRNYAAEAAQEIRCSRGNLSLDELSRRLFISPRQLQRSFKEQIGTGPKTYMRIIRFRNAFQHVQELCEAPDWAGITYEYGYSDQAHLIRDFKAFSGAVPTLLAATDAFYQLTTVAV